MGHQESYYKHVKEEGMREKTMFGAELEQTFKFVECFWIKKEKLEDKM